MGTSLINGDAMDFHGDSSGKQTRLAGRSLTNGRVFLMGKLSNNGGFFFSKPRLITRRSSAKMGL